MSRDALKTFRAAPWTSEEEIAAFAAACTGLTAGDMAKWLAVLLEPQSAADPIGHPKRISAFARIADRVIDGSLFVHYARDLRSPDPRLRAVLVDLLPRVNSVSGHMDLCRLLGSPDPEHRNVASRVLAQIAGKQAFDMLVELVREPSFAGRTEALDLMVPRALHQSSPLLVAVISAGRPQERSHALRLLVENKSFTPHPRIAVDVAARAVNDADERVAAQAVSVVAHHASEEEFHQLVDPLLWSNDPLRARAVVEALRRYPTQRTIALLQRKLAEGPTVVRAGVVETAEAIASEGVLPVLVEAVTSKEIVVRGAALEAIGRLSDGGRIDPARAVLWLLRSRDLEVRRTAVELLNRVGDPRGDMGPMLLRYLRDEDWWVRERTMDALIDIASVTPAADLYALGVVAYEMATGVRPFRHQDPAQVLRLQFTTAAAPPRTLLPSLPAAFDQLVVALLARDPAERPQSAASVRRSLDLIRGAT